MNETLSVQIVDAIAEERGVEPTELGYTLHDYVEMEAIQLLARDETDSWMLSFSVPDGTVTVTGAAGVHVDITDGTERASNQRATD